MPTSGLVPVPAGNGPDAPVNDQGLEKPLAHEPDRGSAGGQGSTPRTSGGSGPPNSVPHPSQ